LAALAMAAVMAATISAHRRDELLQAARIALGPDSVQIDLDLTPGIALASETLAEIDHDRDGTLSLDEQRIYADRVFRALSVSVDGIPLGLEPTASTFPELAAVYRGEGLIRLQASLSLPNQSPGVHHLRFRNDHRPAESAYLANALVPDSPRVAVVAQYRDQGQSELTIEYAIRARPAPLSTGWLVFPAALALAGFSARRALVPRRSATS